MVPAGILAVVESIRLVIVTSAQKQFQENGCREGRPPRPLGDRAAPAVHPAAASTPQGADEMNKALIAEYLALASALRDDSPQSNYQRANQLAFQLAMELDADLWRIVVRAVASGTVDDIWQAIFAAAGPGKIGG